MNDFIALPGAPLPLAGAARPAAPQEAPDDVRRVAEEFESIFIAQMLAPMFQGIETDGLGGGGMGEEMFRPMLIERYAQALSKSGGVGIADSIVRELLRMQTLAQPVENPDGPAG
jgi:Rod binding domain-containing protein